MPIVLATQETYQEDHGSKPQQFKRTYFKKNHHKKRAGGVAQGVGPSTTKKKKKEKEMCNISNCSKIVETPSQLIAEHSHYSRRHK
jgi:hypothetical protein